MQNLKSSILRHVRLQASLRNWSLVQNTSGLSKYSRQFCSTVGNEGDDRVMDRVIGLVKKFNQTDTAKVSSMKNSYGTYMQELLMFSCNLVLAIRLHPHLRLRRREK